MILFETDVRLASRVLGQELLPLWQVYAHVFAPLSFWALCRLAVRKKQAEQGLRVICAHQSL